MEVKMRKNIIFIVIVFSMILALCGSASAADAPSANFTANLTNGSAPLSVQFNDTSKGNPTSWYWDFGDGKNSTEQNPTHVYTHLGNFTVSLNATNSVGTSSVVKTVYAMNSTTFSNYCDLNIYVANDAGVKYNVENGRSQVYTYSYVNNTYFFLLESNGGGFNPIHISNNNASNNFGQVTTTSNQSGTFWITFTGGQATMHEAILMLAVNGTIPDDFSVHITSSGYTWDIPSAGLGNVNDPKTNLNYVTAAVNETFTKNDFIYGPQIWRPSTLSNYPIYYGQNMDDTNNTFHIMFIDLYAGCLQTGIDNGAIRVDYSFNDLTSFAAFNVFGWYSASAHGTGAIMTNCLNASKSKISGFNVMGVPSANFTANVTNGSAPMDVQFNDQSTNSPTSWSWDFGDGTTSTEQNPAHTYTKPGVYTVSLTATNTGGSNTETQIITVNDVTAPIVNSSQVGGVFNTTQTVTLNATDDSDSATIYYTTDGTDPKTSSTRSVYTGPIEIDGTTTLKYAAVDAAGNWSSVYSETYTIKSDVYVQVIPSKTNPQVGDKVNYTFKLCNNGPGIANDVVFTYVIPEGLEYDGATVDQGTIYYDDATRTLTWNLGNVTVGDPYLWLNVTVLSAGSYNLQPAVTTAGYDPELNSSIGSLLVNAVSATDNGSGSGSGSDFSTGNNTTVHAVTTTTTKTVPMQDTGLPLGGLVSALLLAGSGLALSRKK